MIPRSRPPAVRSWRRVVVALAVVPLALGCGGDERTVEPVRPPGPPVLRIEALRPAGAPVWQPEGDASCVDIGRDPAGTLAVDLGQKTGDRSRLVNWTFRSFGGCTGALQCGPVRITVEQGDRTAEVFGLSVSVAVPFRQLGFGEGPTIFRAELMNDDGSPFVLDGGVAVSAEVRVDVLSRCTPFADAGAAGDAAGGTDAGLDGGIEEPVPDASRDAARDAAALPDGAPPEDASEAGRADAAAAPDATAPDASAPDASSDASRADASPDGG
jgi:hypothetical protein